MSNISIEEIKAILFQLPEQELVALVADIEERLQTTAMMHIAETGFYEWDDDEAEEKSGVMLNSHEKSL